MYTGKLVKVSLLSRRKPTVSEEEYHKHWAEVHGPLVAEWLQRYGIKKYTQFHKTSAKMRDANPSAPGGIALGNFDGIADFYVRSYEEFTKAFEDPYYLEVVRPDEEKFVDMDSIVVTIGYEHVVFETDDFNESNKPEGA